MAPTHKHEYSIVPTSDPPNDHAEENNNNVCHAEPPPDSNDLENNLDFSVELGPMPSAENPIAPDHIISHQPHEYAMVYTSSEASGVPEASSAAAQTKHLCDDDFYVGEFDIMMMTLLTGFVMCLVFSPATPYLELRSLTIPKFNSSNSRTERDLKGMWNVQLAVHNFETRWEGCFKDVNCTLYREIQTTNTFEDPSTLLPLAYVRILEPFNLGPREERLLQLKLDVQETNVVNDWDMATFGIRMSAYISFDNSSSGWFSGIDDYHCSNLKINKETGALLNDVPVTCEFSLPFQPNDDS